VNLRVWDSTGKLVYQIEADFSEGLHQWQLDGKDLADNGTYWYEISIQNHSERGKIIYLMD
jgi:flagellar hook assembly protein FlgD